MTNLRLQRVGRPKKEDERQSRERILESAEALFAERGLHRVSIRDITEKAHVNVALVKYYFGSRQGLLEEVIKRSTAATIAERHLLLDDCVARINAGHKLDVTDIIRAYIGPALTAVPERATDNDAARSVVGFAWVDPDPRIRRLMNSIYRGPVERFLTILRSVGPDLSPEEFGWRSVCILSVAYTMVSDSARVEDLVGSVDFRDKESLMTYVISFLAAGASNEPTPTD